MNAPPSLDPAQQAPLWALTARLLLSEPDEELRAVLAAPPARDSLRAIEADLARWLAGEEAEEAPGPAEDFVRLFVAPCEAPPYASAWLPGERELLGARIHDFVGRVLSALGRERVVRPPWGRLPLDHLGLLCELVAAAATEGEPARRRAGELLRSEVLDPCLFPFGRRLRERARHPLYRAAGTLLVALAPE